MFTTTSDPSSGGIKILLEEWGKREEGAAISFQSRRHAGIVVGTYRTNTLYYGRSIDANLAQRANVFFTTILLCYSIYNFYL
jgi:hypothetical protein